MLIPLKEYAERIGKNPANMRQKAIRGMFKTAKRIGRDWFIDDQEEYIDGRIKSGDYIDWKYGKNRKKSAAQKTSE